MYISEMCVASKEALQICIFTLSSISNKQLFHSSSLLAAVITLIASQKIPETEWLIKNKEIYFSHSESWGRSRSWHCSIPELYLVIALLLPYKCVASCSVSTIEGARERGCRSLCEDSHSYDLITSQDPLKYHHTLGLIQHTNLWVRKQIWL